MTTKWARAICSLFLCGPAAAIDLAGLQHIGAVRGVIRTEAGITLACDGGSEVTIRVLAPDLVRVRAAFLQKIPQRDHSWAIEKTSWTTPRWTFVEEPAEVRIATDELELAVRRSPLQLEFRDAKTHSVIFGDQQPMLFDPKSGVVAAAPRLGLNDHFYGLGEKAAHLDKRRGEFAMWNSDTFGYQEGTDPIYQSVPFYLGWRQGKSYGIFFDNSYRTHFDFGASSQEYAAFSAEGGEMNYYFFWGLRSRRSWGATPI